MSQDFGTPITPAEPTKNNTTIWIIVVIIVLLALCCCCVLAGSFWALWTYGDQWFSLDEGLHLLQAFV